MSLTVLSIAYPFAPVAADAVGGAEQVLFHLDAMLVQQGHRSMVMAAEGSRVSGKLLEIPKLDQLTDTAREEIEARTYEILCYALDRYDVDLVHYHGVDFYQYLAPEGVPVLVTLHLPIGYYPLEALQTGRPETYFHCVSQSQHYSCPPLANLLEPIPNGIGTPGGLFKKRPLALSLGRICPEKGFHIALKAAAEADMLMVLAGKVFPYPDHEAYFQTEIAPRLDSKRRFIGPIGPAHRERLMSAARCLLAPSLVPETSSLVALEALSCGTPVIAFPTGAFPDLIENGINGFLVSNTTEMIHAIKVCTRINPEDCRRSVQEHFSLNEMLSRYLELYNRLAHSEPQPKQSMPEFHSIS